MSHSFNNRENPLLNVKRLVRSQDQKNKMSFTIKLESGEIAHIPWHAEYCMGDLLTELQLRLGEDLDLETLAFYDGDLRLYPFGEDSQLVEENQFFHIFTLNLNLVRFFHNSQMEARFSGKTHYAVQTWPWVLTAADEELMHAMRMEEEAMLAADK